MLEVTRTPELTGHRIDDKATIIISALGKLSLEYSVNLYMLDDFSMEAFIYILGEDSRNMFYHFDERDPNLDDVIDDFANFFVHTVLKDGKYHSLKVEYDTLNTLNDAINLFGHYKMFDKIVSAIMNILYDGNIKVKTYTHDDYKSRIDYTFAFSYPNGTDELFTLYDNGVLSVADNKAELLSYDEFIKWVSKCATTYTICGKPYGLFSLMLGLPIHVNTK